MPLSKKKMGSDEGIQSDGWLHYPAAFNPENITHCVEICLNSSQF
jgi:hypothetical protein